MTNSGAYPADFQAPESLDGWGTQQMSSSQPGTVAAGCRILHMIDAAMRSVYASQK